jgi:hypothetical protein
MWLQRGDVPFKFFSLQHIGGVLLNVSALAGLRYRDNDIDLSQCIGFTQHETLMINVEGEAPKRITGTVIGLITPRSACLKMSEIAKGRLSKEVMRAQAHHYILVPDFEFDERKSVLTTHFYKKMWAVHHHQYAELRCKKWGEFITHIIQNLFRMDHPTDLSVKHEAIEALEQIMLKQPKLSSR